MKKVVCLVLCILMALIAFAGCAQPAVGQDPGSSEPQTKDPQTESPSAQDPGTEAPSGEKPLLDETAVYGKGPNGETATSYLELSLTEEEKAKLKEGNFRVALNFHMLSNPFNYVKKDVIVKELEEAGVEIVAITDGQQDAAKMVDDIDTTIALKPDLIFTIAYDPSTQDASFRRVQEAGIKMVFFECAPSSMTAGEDYEALVSTDFYGNGRMAAEWLAWKLNYEGTVGMTYLDADVWTCLQRDEAFRTVMAKYPGIKIVAEEGYAAENAAGSAADGILAKFPDVDAIYSTWDGPAIQAAASAKAVGRNDLIISTVDLGDDSARMIATDDILRFTATGSPYDDGMANAMVIMYALLDKELPSTFIATPSTGVENDNVLDVYKEIFNTDPPKELVEAYTPVG